MTTLSHDKPFKIHTCCILVKGANRSTICDIQRNLIHLIPHILYEILMEFDGKTIYDVKSHFNFEYDNYIDEYFEFLADQEIVFNTSSPESFPAMNLQWHTPLNISSCIIDMDENSSHEFKKIAKSLNNVGCRNLEIRSFYTAGPEVFEEVLGLFNGSTVIAIAIITKFSDRYNLDDWKSLCDKYPRLVSLTLHGYQENDSTTSPAYQTPIIFAETVIVNEKCCGKIHEQNFSALTESFSEALNFNTCLNGKISIDRNGNIKNCPSSSTVLGHINTQGFENVAEDPRLKTLWRIGKDKIEGCRDCEFRYVCMDCRAYLEEPGNIYSKPLKCGYDPYTTVWEDWSTNPLKQTAKNYYNL